ncbi:MAG: DUF3341 domain-containing protein [Oligoflexia bacterium]|nr:DUF3341 domain-containing protein [Oligoflexia bacterium]
MYKNYSGVIGVFTNEGDLLKAAREAREKMKYKNFDAFTPYPVHGLDDAMGLKRSWLPYVTFVAGLTGFLTASALQIWTSAFDWPVNIGGKPFISFPAFVPIMFELTVLFGGLATVGALFWVCGFPNKTHNFLHPRITNDRFVLYIPSNEKNYSESEAKSFLAKFHPEEVSVVNTGAVS